MSSLSTGFQQGKALGWYSHSGSAILLTMPSHLNPSVRYLRLGDHICLFYRSQAEWLATVVPYVQFGLERNEKCVCVQSSRLGRVLRASLVAEGFEVDRLVARGALVLLEPEQAYLDCGKFDPGAMARLLASHINKAVRSGFSGFRVTGDMRWALDKKPGCNRLLEYETLMESFFPVKPAIGLCAYPVKYFSASKLRDVLRVHHLGLLEGCPGEKHRTLSIHSGTHFGEVAFNSAASAPIHCRIVQRFGNKSRSWSHETLGAAIGSVKRQLHELR